MLIILAKKISKSNVLLKSTLKIIKTIFNLFYAIFYYNNTCQNGVKLNFFNY